MEREQNSRLRGVLVIAATAAVIYESSKLAFSRHSREEILERDNYRCVICGSTQHLQAAHYDHSRATDHYDDPDNGTTLCIEHHLEDHIKREGANGLTQEQNQWAIGKLRQTIEKSEADIAIENLRRHSQQQDQQKLGVLRSKLAAVTR